MTMHRALTFLSIPTLVLSFAYLSHAQNQTPPVPATTPEEPPVLAVPKGYHYNAHGRRDPFVNPVPKPKKPVVQDPEKRPPGLKGLLVEEAQIAGVVTSRDPGMNVVIISANGVKTPYFAHIGDQ